MTAPDETISEAAQPDEITAEDPADQMLLYAFDQAVEMLETGEGFDPFTILLKDDEFFVEEHPGDEIEECYASARRTVFQMALVASDYVFCYDGFVELEDGQSDAIIVERAHKGDEAGEAFAMLYHAHDEHFHFDETLYGIGEAPNYFAEGAAGADDDADGDAADDDGAAAGAAASANGDEQ